MYVTLILTIALLLALAGCVPVSPTPVPTATPTSTASPTQTPTCTPTATPTSTPEAEALPWRGTIGICHGVSYPSPFVDWAYPSGESVFWSSVETAPGEYDFAPLWEYVRRAEGAGRYVVLQVQTNSPGRFEQPTIPPFYWGQIAELPDCPTSVPDCGNYWHSKPAPWDEDYLAAVERLAQAFAEEFDGHPAVMGVLIAGPGNYNEMSQTVGACYGQPGADVTRTDSVYIRSLAEATGEAPADLVAPYVDEQGRHYAVKHDYYYVQATERLARAYLDAFRRTPSILQVGSGASCQMYVADYVVSDLLEDYAGRLWLKQNGWGNTMVPGYTYAWDAFFARLRGEVRTMYEVGHYGLWCSPAHPDGVRYGCANEDAAAHNRAVIEHALSAGVSAVCFQPVFFRRPDLYGLDTAMLSYLEAGLVANGGGR